MIGVVLVSHGRIAEAFLDVACEILGPVEAVRVVSMSEPFDEERVLKEVRKAGKAIDSGDGVLILTDMFGGTPANLCFSLLEQDRFEVLTGMNLPMVLMVLSSRHEAGLVDLARMGRECGRENIDSGRELLEKGQKIPGRS